MTPGQAGGKGERTRGSQAQSQRHGGGGADSEGEGERGRGRGRGSGDGAPRASASRDSSQSECGRRGAVARPARGRPGRAPPPRARTFPPAPQCAPRAAPPASALREPAQPVRVPASRSDLRRRAQGCQAVEAPLPLPRGWPRSTLRKLVFLRSAPRAGYSVLLRWTGEVAADCHWPRSLTLASPPLRWTRGCPRRAGPG